MWRSQTIQSGEYPSNVHLLGDTETTGYSKSSGSRRGRVCGICYRYSSIKASRCTSTHPQCVCIGDGLISTCSGSTGNEQCSSVGSSDRSIVGGQRRDSNTGRIPARQCSRGSRTRVGESASLNTKHLTGGDWSCAKIIGENTYAVHGNL